MNFDILFSLDSEKKRTMFCQKSRGFLGTASKRILTGALALVSTTVGFALTMSTPPKTVGDLTRQADDVIIGNVVSESPRVVGRSFETSYEIEISESLKSTSPGFGSGEKFVLTLPGAALTTPPITQYVTGVPYIGKGEEVLLFLQKSKREAPPQAKSAASIKDVPVSLLASSPTIVGWNQGRFSIYSSPQSGAKMVTRVNFEDYGLINSGPKMKELMDSLRANRVKTLETRVVRAADQDDKAKAKDPLEVTNFDAKNIANQSALKHAEAFQKMRQGPGIPVQSLESLKAEIREHANETK